MDVSIEALKPAEFGRVSQWLSDPEINRWLVSELRGREISELVVAAMVRNPRNHLLLVRADGDPCGLVGFSDLDRTDAVAMIWYVLGQGSRSGTGVTTRAVAQAVDMGFDEQGLASVYAWIIEGNEGSRRVLEKCGFRLAGRVRDAVSWGEERRDRVYYDRVRGSPE